MSAVLVQHPPSKANLIGAEGLVPALPEVDLLSQDSCTIMHPDDSKADESFWNTLADITQTAGSIQTPPMGSSPQEPIDLVDMDDIAFDLDLSLSASPATSLPMWNHSRCSSGSSSGSSSDHDSGMDADSDSGCEGTTSPGSVASVSHEALTLFPPAPNGGGEGAATSLKSQINSHSAKQRFARTRPTVSQPRTSEALVASITDRERELLKSKGEIVPTAASLPLTKMEERRLRASLRKIRNKDSAIRSRKKKEVYVAGLEHRVEECTRINIELTTKVSTLEATNKSLLEQLNDLRRQLSLAPYDSSVGSTMMMMVIVCCGLVVTDGGMGSMQSSPATITPSGFRSRTLQSVGDSEPLSNWWLGDQDDLFDAVLFTAVLRWLFAFIIAGAFWYWMKSYTRQREAKLR